MVRYAPINFAPRLAQVTPADASPPRSGLSAAAINVGVVLFGGAIAMAGYHNRKTDLGTIAMGAGSSIVGAGILILALQIAGFRQIQF